MEESGADGGLHVLRAARVSISLSFFFFHVLTPPHIHKQTHYKSQEWAAEEAETRLARIEDGKDVEYGRIYHKQLLTGGFVEHSALRADNPPEEIEGEEDEE